MIIANTLIEGIIIGILWGALTYLYYDKVMDSLKLTRTQKNILRFTLLLPRTVDLGVIRIARKIREVAQAMGAMMAWVWHNTYGRR